MNLNDKRSMNIKDGDEPQRGNRLWWSSNSMSYDWKNNIRSKKYSKEWFDEVDQRFIYGARLFAHFEEPFDRVIPTRELKDKMVLEIGCGMGLHTELLIRAGANVTSIDLTEEAIEATTNRLKLKNLKASLYRMDAELADFSDESFDFIWSWGVIHHSSSTSLIIRNASRMLKKDGRFYFMVYNSNGMQAYLTWLRCYLISFWRGKTFDECLWNNTDGFMARYYSADTVSDLLSPHFIVESIESLGQDSDAIPLPRSIRRSFVALVNNSWLAKSANRRGSLLFVRARKK